MLIGVDMAPFISPFRGTLRVVDSLQEKSAQSSGVKGGEAPLPWWMNPVNIVLMVVASILLSGAIAFVVGESQGRGSHNGSDIGFLQDMRIHHEQAVNMSLIYLDTSHSGMEDGLASRGTLRLIAREIIVTQSSEAGRMVQLLRQFNASETNETDQVMGWMNEPLPLAQMPGYATDAELDALHAARGVEADKLFTTLMIAHHKGGLHMAEHAQMHASNDEVTALAGSMVSAQTSEIAEMKKLVAAG